MFSLAVHLHQVVIWKPERTLFSCSLRRCHIRYSLPSSTTAMIPQLNDWWTMTPKPKAAVGNMLLLSYSLQSTQVHTHTRQASPQTLRSTARLPYSHESVSKSVSK